MLIEPFSTDRFVVDPWLPQIRNPEARGTLETSLASILTPKVLAHLPGSLQLEPGDTAVSEWIDARAAESDVLTVRSVTDRGLIGLVILALTPDAPDRPTMHIGYLLAESVWGQGAASEIVKGLVLSLRSAAALRIVGGVDTGNPASARVLQKAGFVLDPDLSRPGGETYVLDIP